MKTVALEIFNKLSVWKKGVRAPVDLFGSSIIRWDNESFESKKWQLLISLLLSSRTKDEITSNAVKNLHDKVGSFTSQKLRDLSPQIIYNCISSVGFAKKKTSYIIEAAKSIEIVPIKYDELIKIKGFGPKMAYLFLSSLGENKGIAVDTHVIRISQRLGLSNNKNPEAIRKDLEKLFLNENWHNVNQYFVSLGQLLCKSKKPLCNNCPILAHCNYSKALKF